MTYAYTQAAVATLVGRRGLAVARHFVLPSVTSMTTRPYTQVKRAQERERTRGALLDAARDVFLSGAWEETSLEAIAARAGVTKQTLLRHFGSKRGLLEAGAQR